MSDSRKLRFHPLTSERWQDFERLFGRRGACGGCWCMPWRLSRSEFERSKGDGTRARMRALVRSGAEPGILGYMGDEAVAWCAVAPREQYPVLSRSRILRPLDAERVWSIACFYIDKRFRRRGLSVAMLNAAKTFVADKGGKIIEGYPVEPRTRSMPDVFAHTGVAAAFRKAGFREATRRSPRRPIMRFEVLEAIPRSLAHCRRTRGLQHSAKAKPQHRSGRAAGKTDRPIRNSE
jgi:GNAT superfamily N-acetyltransferase